MKNYILMLLLLMFPTVNVFAEVSGGIGYSSDYFFRGTSQTSGNPSASAWVDWNSDEGVYVGTWAGQVDFNDNASLESNLYLGYGYELTDKLSYDLGIIQYRYNHDYDNLEEIYIGVSYNNVGVYHYIDTDSKAKFTEVSYNLWFVPLVDASISYSDAKLVQLDIDYTINDSFTLGVDVIDLGTSSHDYKVKNEIAVGLSYNF